MVLAQIKFIVWVQHVVNECNERANQLRIYFHVLHRWQQSPWCEAVAAAVDERHIRNSYYSKFYITCCSRRQLSVENFPFSYLENFFVHVCELYACTETIHCHIDVDRLWLADCVLANASEQLKWCGNIVQCRTKLFRTLVGERACGGDGWVWAQEFFPLTIELSTNAYTAHRNGECTLQWVEHIHNAVD